MEATASRSTEVGSDVAADFLHYMRGVVIFLGGRVDIADKLEHLCDIDAGDADDLGQYLIDLEENLKDRMAAQHRLRIVVGQPE